jgi:hypothetical protein
MEITYGPHRSNTRYQNQRILINTQSRDEMVAYQRFVDESYERWRNDPNGSRQRGINFNAELVQACADGDFERVLELVIV